MEQPQLIAMLEGLIARALDAGACHADAIAVQELTLQAEARMGALERLQQEERLGVGLRVFVETKDGLAFATLSAQRPDETDLAELAQRAVAMARLGAPDPEAVPPVGAAHPEAAALRAWLAAQPDAMPLAAEEARAMALQLDAAARAVDGVATAEGASAAASYQRIGYAASDGFMAEYPRVQASLSVVAVAKRNGEMQRDYEWRVARSKNALPSPDALGRAAGMRAVQRLGARTPPTGRQPVVFEPRVAAQLLGHYASAASGLAVLRRRSFLADALGEQLFAPFVTIVDDPAHPEGVEDRLFDGEGVATRRLAWVEDGVLKSFFTNRYAARRLGHPETAHAVRDLAGDIGIAPSNLVLQPGTHDAKAILADIGEGILVTELIGFGVNPVTGDFSFGAAGFRIHAGEPAEPVQGMTIAGNLRAMARAITHLGNDLTWFGARAAPSVAVETLTIAGR